MTGETILHYKILEKLGEGGMGEVYKAQDTKLERFVALKFLPTNLTATETEKARFIQEAKAASAMNHPNVCTIHDIQEHEGRLFIVMEFVDGKTLKDKKGSLTEKQILEIGIQTAEGLAAAHEKGIVHRDIKPENIMIRRDGIVQIMDFGLAKLFAPGDASRLTRMGTTMGTVGYMSPEQVQGLDVDHRTDIFSLGVVLYEMISGESPFKGMHETAIMYEIVNVDAAPISTVKEGINPEIDSIILECLEKDKDDRCQSAKELSKNLRKIKRVSAASRASRIYNVNSQELNAKSGQTQSYEQPQSKSIGEIQVKNLAKNLFYNPKIYWGISFICLTALLYLLFAVVLNKTEIIKPTTLTTILPPDQGVYENSFGSNLAISPDSKYVAFIADDSTGDRKLWIRPISSNTPRVLADAPNFAYPFWSPDNKFIAFFKGNELVKVSLESGTILPICEAPAGRGGSWSKNGTIVFAPRSNAGIYKVPASGGQAEEIIKIDTSKVDLSLRWPFFLPDGEKFLYLYGNYAESSSNEEGIYIASLDGKINKKLNSIQSNAQYADGYIFYVNQHVLLSQKLDLNDLELKGDIQPIAKDLQFYDIRSSGTFSVSNIGNLVYQKVYDSSKDIAFLDKNGNLIKKLFDKDVRFIAKLSPKDDKIAFDSFDEKQTNSDIWTYDVIRNVTTRLTFDKAIDLSPLWSNDGAEIYFTSNREKGKPKIFFKNADGSGQITQFYSADGAAYPSDISKDGNILAVSLNSNKPNSGWGLVIINASDKTKPVIDIDTKYNENQVSISPNQKWFLYTSNESGNPEVYVSPLDGSDGKWQISVNGGNGGKWMDNGKKIYYKKRDNKIYAVDLNESKSSISPGKPYLVFSPNNTLVERIFDISKDGNKILAEIPKSTNAVTPYTFITNWQQIVEKIQ